MKISYCLCLILIAPALAYSLPSVDEFTSHPARGESALSRRATTRKPHSITKYRVGTHSHNHPRPAPIVYDDVEEGFDEDDGEDGDDGDSEATVSAAPEAGQPVLNVTQYHDDHGKTNLTAITTEHLVVSTDARNQAVAPHQTEKYGDLPVYRIALLLVDYAKSHANTTRVKKCKTRKDCDECGILWKDQCCVNMDQYSVSEDKAATRFLSSEEMTDGRGNCFCGIHQIQDNGGVCY